MFSFPELYEEAVSRAGGEQSTAEDVLKVQRAIRIVLETWMARGFNTWRIQQQSVVASPGAPCVALSPATDDVLQVNGVRAGTASTYNLTRIASSEYMTLSDKDRPGPPSQYWLERSVPQPRLHLFPTGAPEGTVLTVWYVARPSSFAPGESDASSVPGRWLSALVTAVAHDLACKRPSPGGEYNEPLIRRLKDAAVEAEDIALRADRDRVRFTYRISH